MYLLARLPAVILFIAVDEGAFSGGGIDGLDGTRAEGVVNPKLVEGVTRPAPLAGVTRPFGMDGVTRPLENDGVVRPNVEGVIRPDMEALVDATEEGREY